MFLVVDDVSDMPCYTKRLLGLSNLQRSSIMQETPYAKGGSVMEIMKQKKLKDVRKITVFFKDGTVQIFFIEINDIFHMNNDDKNLAFGDFREKYKIAYNKKIKEPNEKDVKKFKNKLKLNQTEYLIPFDSMKYFTLNYVPRKEMKREILNGLYFENYKSWKYRFDDYDDDCGLGFIDDTYRG